MVGFNDLGDFPILLWALGWLESFSLLNPLCFPPLSCPQEPLSTAREKDRRSTSYTKTQHTLCPMPLFPTNPAVPVGEAAQSYGTAARMPLQIQLYHQILTVFKGLAIQIQLSHFKKDSVHTENPAFKKVQELKQIPQNKKDHWFLKKWSHCQLLACAGLLTHPAVSNQVHLGAPHTEGLSPAFLISRWQINLSRIGETRVCERTNTEWMLSRNWVLCLFFFRKKKCFCRTTQCRITIQLSILELICLTCPQQKIKFNKGLLSTSSSLTCCILLFQFGDNFSPAKESLWPRAWHKTSPDRDIFH